MGLSDLLDLIGVDFEFTSPRESFGEWVIGRMLDPYDIDIATQDYANLLRFFMFFAVPAIGIGLLFALWNSATKQDFVHLKQWAISSLAVIFVLGSGPAFLVGLRWFLNAVGRNIFRVVQGDLDNIMELTGKWEVDAILSTIQVVAMFFIAIEMVLIMAAFFVSAILIMWGCMFRSWPHIGDEWLEIALKVTIYGVAGNFVGLTVMAFVSVLGRFIAPDDKTWTGLVNVVAFVATAIVLWAMAKSIGGKLKTTVSGVKAGVNSVRGRRERKGSSYERDGGSRQTEAESEAHLRHTKRGSRRGKRSKAENANASEDSSSETSSDAGKISKDARKPTEPKHTSTRARLRSRRDGKSNQDTDVSRRQKSPDSAPPQNQSRQNVDSRSTKRGYDDSERQPLQRSTEQPDSSGRRTRGDSKTTSERR